MTVTVEGWPAVARAIGRVPAACERAGARAALDAAKALAASTRPTLPVRTGRLRASVEVAAVEGGAAVTITAPYAIYVPAARRMATSSEAAAADYARTARTNTTAEIARLPWP